MTLENCRILLKHFNDLADGTIPRPVGHKDWGDVMKNAEVRAVEMEKRIERKESDSFKEKHGIPMEKPKAKEKKSGKRSA